MSRDAVDVAALAADVARVREAVRALVEVLTPSPDRGPGDYWPLSHGESAAILAALDAPATDPAPPLADRNRVASDMIGQWAREPIDGDDLPLATPPPPMLDAETRALMLAARMAVLGYRDTIRRGSSPEASSFRDRMDALASALRAAAGPTP